MLCLVAFCLIKYRLKHFLIHKHISLCICANFGALKQNSLQKRSNQKSISPFYGHLVTLKLLRHFTQ